ncbi:SCF ubiquitin ligase complex subunit cdc4 [Coemansia sp. Benny D115]|nr:SCF ubiquitin ligase complex subunit cdc4 [Coemansia sp. Benny D115]
MGSKHMSRPMLSAQTVTTTTVTTTTVTTYPPLKLPHIPRHNLLNPDLYPLASVPAPPSLEQFAIDVNGQQLFFSQGDLAAFQDADILESIAANTSAAATAAVAATMHDDIEDDVMAEAVPRAMTPLYTQDDATKDAERQLRHHAGAARRFASTAFARVAGSGGSAGGRVASDGGNGQRRSSSPPPASQRGQMYSRNSLSPPPSHVHRQASAELDGGLSAEQQAVATVTSAPSPELATAVDAHGLPDVDALDDSVLPLPSPLLSPRARPESMDTDDLLDHAQFASASRRALHFPADAHGGSADAEISPPISGRQSGAFDTHEGIVNFVASSSAQGGGRRGDAFAATSATTEDVDEYGYTRRRTTRTTQDAASQPMAKDMAALYNLPSIMSTYDNLPTNMQTYLLYQLLRRTPRPVLQFATQTMLPVLHRDFIGGLPSEAAHHVLKFMDTRTLCRAACVSRRWQAVIDGDRAVWRAKLLDAKYVPETPRVHPLCHTHFGLGPEPERPITHNLPTMAELQLAQLAPRTHSARATYQLQQQLQQQRTQHDSDTASYSPPANPFKERFATDYRLNRNWHEGKCRQFNFVCDGGSVVTCVQLTEKYIIAGFDTKNIFVLDINTGEAVRQLVGHEGGVWALAVVGNTIISGSTDRSVRIWDLETGKCTHVFSGHSSTVRCLQVLLPTDVRTSKERAMGMPVRYEPSEPLIITGSRDTTLRVWKLPSPKFDPSYSPRTGLAPARGASRYSNPQAAGGDPAATLGSRLSSQPADSDDSNMVVDAEENDSDQSAAPVSSTGPTTRSATDDPADAASDDAAYDASDNPRANPYFVRTFEGHTDSVRAVAGYGNMVVSGSYDFSIRVWNLESGSLVHRLEGHTSKVYTIVLDTDQHLIFSGSMDGTIRVWNWDTGSCLRILRGHLTLVGLLALKHGTLVSAGADTTLRIWDHPMKKCPSQSPQQRPFSNIPGDTIPNMAALNGQANMAAAAAHANAAFVGPHALAQNANNLQQAHLLQQLHLQQRANDQLHQQQMQDASADMIRYERSVLRQHTNAITCFQHDGTKIVSGADTTLKLWDVRTGAFVRDLLANLASVWQVKFDKRRCVAAVNRNEVTYFEVMDFQ